MVCFLSMFKGKIVKKSYALVLVLVVRMVRTEPYMQVSHFWDLAAHPRGMHPFNPVMLGIGRDPTASSILTPHNSCDLTPPMRGTQQIWNLVWQEGPYDNHTTPRTNPQTPREFGVDPRLGAVTLRAPSASREDSRPQTLLKFHRPSSLDYRARHRLPVNILDFD